MNQTSSRSHAIFTVFLEQQKPRLDDYKPGDVIDLSTVQYDTYISKFNFVDLAGSERVSPFLL
jgi:hypothetical protein